MRRVAFSRVFCNDIRDEVGRTRDQVSFRQLYTAASI